jgi:hypothetical protein
VALLEGPASSDAPLPQACLSLPTHLVEVVWIGPPVASSQCFPLARCGRGCLAVFPLLWPLAERGGLLRRVQLCSTSCPRCCWPTASSRRCWPMCCTRWPSATTTTSTSWATTVSPTAHGWPKVARGNTRGERRRPCQLWLQGRSGKTRMVRSLALACPLQKTICLLCLEIRRLI